MTFLVQLLDRNEVGIKEAKKFGGLGMRDFLMTQVLPIWERYVMAVLIPLTFGKCTVSEVSFDLSKVWNG